MPCVRFLAYGHENVIGQHRTTLEITTENFLTREGTCIVGINANQTLAEMPPEVKRLAQLESTVIVLRLQAGDDIQEIRGRGGPGLVYTDTTSMVVRTSSYQCGRTLMVGADKAASDLDRRFVRHLADSNAEILCEIEFITQ